MRVLWICNILFPEASDLLLGADSDKPFSGGWMVAAASAICHEGVELTVSTVTPLVSQVTFLKGREFDYCLIPYGTGAPENNAEYDSCWQVVSDRVHPDIIHVHGTEYPYGLSCVKVLGPSRIIVSIQGLLSVIQHYYLDGLTKRDLFSSISVRDVLKGETLFQDKRSFQYRAEYEVRLLRQVRHVIGRTSWDKDAVMSINPGLHYHFCNEILRPPFYTDKWVHKGNREIFVSQASYPIKGFHQLLRALALMEEKPYVKVAGQNLTGASSFFKKLKMRSYGVLLNRLMRKFNLKDNVSFLGPLDVASMKKAYLMSDVFICPSSVENSCNSIGEAQLLGVPVIASDRGGNASLVQDGKTGFLYDYYDVKALASLIEKVLGNDCASLSSEERRMALIRHDPLANAKRMKDIYIQVIASDS